MQRLVDIRWCNYGESIPAFLTIVLMPLTYSVSHSPPAFCTFVCKPGKMREASMWAWFVLTHVCTFRLPTASSQVFCLSSSSTLAPLSSVSCVCARACARACVFVRVRACVCTYACVCLSVCASPQVADGTPTALKAVKSVANLLTLTPE